MSNVLRAILTLLSVFVMTATARAIDATEFLDKYEHGDVTERQKLLIVIKGLEEGISWADAYNQAHGVARIYCPPGRFLSLEPERLIDMLRREVEARPDIRSRAVAAGDDRGASERVSLQAAAAMMTSTIRLQPCRSTQAKTFVAKWTKTI